MLLKAEKRCTEVLEGLCLNKNIIHCGFINAPGFFSEWFSTISSFNINLWWLSCSSFMAMLDLMLSSFHFPMLDVTFLSLLYSTGEYKKWQDVSQWPVSARVVNALDKIIGHGEYKPSLLSWFRDCPKEVTSMLWRLCGNGHIAPSTSQEKLPSSQWGESRGELYLIDCKTGNKAIIKFITALL